MYHVYLNDCLIEFSSNILPEYEADLILKLTGFETRDHLQKIVSSIENGGKVDHIVFLSENIDRTWSTFCSNYKIIQAAGGVVYNSIGSLLLIFRNGKWDLPKGKIEFGEEPDAAAIREVNEECGIGYLQLEKQVRTTYHVYTMRSEKILKQTYWYIMTTKDTTLPVPQAEEGILEAKWMTRAEVHQILNNAYPSIVSLIKEQLPNTPSSYLG